MDSDGARASSRTTADWTKKSVVRRLSEHYVGEYMLLNAIRNETFEECKEAILKLSEEETFWAVPDAQSCRSW
jgi:hypothetical protein